MLTGGLPAVAAQGAIRESVDVRIVNVDVWVSHRDGGPVQGLDRGDFELLEDGKPVAVTHFAEIAGGRARSDEGVSAAPEARHLILYLDRSRMRPSSYESVLRDIAELATSDAIEAENVLILRQDLGLSIVSPFGSNQSELIQAIAKLRRETPAGPDLDHDAQLAVEAVRSTWQEISRPAGSGSDSISTTPGLGAPGGGLGSVGGSPREVTASQGSDLGMGGDSCRTFHGQIQPILDSWTRDRSQRVGLTLTNLSEIATSVAGLPGVKTLVYFSDGLETQPGAALATYANGLCPGGGSNLLHNTQSSELAKAFQQLSLQAASNRVTIYSVEAAGARSRLADSTGRGAGDIGGNRAQSNFESVRRSGQRDGLRRIAEETGGRALLDRSELEPDLRGIVEESGNHYSLAFQPTRSSSARRSGGERREHEIEVRLRDRSLTARYRRGYVEKDPDTWLTERVLGALNLGIADNPLEARLGAGQVSAGDDGGFRFPLHVMVPVEHLAFVDVAASPGDEMRIAELQVAVLARHIDTGVIVRRDQNYRLKGAPGATGVASLPIEMQLEGGVYLTAVGVRDQTTGEASFISTTLQVGDGGSAAP
jgi:VWFA-related protein